jgi:tRNA1(Val) A37 N6-methylase TrmN6
MIHRPYRLIEIIRVLTKYRLEPKRMRFVHPYVNKEPNMVLMEAVKEGNPRVKIEKPLVIYKAKGIYEDEIKEIYSF